MPGEALLHWNKNEPLLLTGKVSSKYSVEATRNFLAHNKYKVMAGCGTVASISIFGAKSTFVFLGQSVVWFVAIGIAGWVWYHRTRVNRLVLHDTIVRELNKNRKKWKK